MLGNSVISQKFGDIFQLSKHSTRIRCHLPVNTRGELRGWDQKMHCPLFLKPLDCVRGRYLAQFKVRTLLVFALWVALFFNQFTDFDCLVANSC